MDNVSADKTVAPPPRGDFITVLYAGFMAFILPGFGQMHNAQLNKGLWVFLIFCTASLCFIALVSLLAPERFLLPALGTSLIVTFGTWVYGIVDAMWFSWRSPATPMKWQTLPVYILALLFAYLVVFKGVGGYVRANYIEPFRIPSQSMAPGILQGDFLFADKRVNCPGCSQRVNAGDVVLFVYPDNRNMIYIKRIVGMPGDVIEIEGIDVRRNGRTLTVEAKDESNGVTLVTERGKRGQYTVKWSQKDNGKQSFTVPHGQVFVMGDNRNHSQDSRRFGPIPLSDVIGIARHTWLSLDRQLNIQWDRMGKKIR